MNLSHYSLTSTIQPKSELLCKDQRSHIHRVNTAKVTPRPNLNVNSGTAI